MIFRTFCERTTFKSYVLRSQTQHVQTKADERHQKHIFETTTFVLTLYTPNLCS